MFLLAISHINAKNNIFLPEVKLAKNLFVQF